MFFFTCHKHWGRTVLIWEGTSLLLAQSAVTLSFMVLRPGGYLIHPKCTKWLSPRLSFLCRHCEESFHTTQDILAGSCLPRRCDTRNACLGTWGRVL